MDYSDNLLRMKELLKKLGNPEKDFKVFHIAGTNGKGSTAHMIAAVLEAEGYSVGLYTSPHLETCCERIQIWNGNHEMIPEHELDALKEQVNKAASEMKELGDLHEFELLTAVAYLYFAEKNPDYVVLECGLGGRLDQTNTFDKPLVSVITQIGLDHTEQLGKTIFKVAREKGGIIKPGVPVVSQTRDLSTMQILAKIAKERGSEYIDASAARSKFRKYNLAMKGKYQLDNAATAVLAIKSAGVDVSEDSIKKGLETAVVPGRFEILGEQPIWIFDGAHNPDAVKATMETFDFVRKTKKIKKTLVVFGCMQDKNYSRMIQLIHEYARGCDFATVDIGNSRAENATILGQCFADIGHECVCYESVQEAYDSIKTQNYDSVLVLGSIYLTGAMRKLYVDERV